MFCTKCGVSVADGSSFCPECGQDLRIPADINSGDVIQQPQSTAADQSAESAAGEAANAEPIIMAAAAVPASVPYTVTAEAQPAPAPDAAPAAQPAPAPVSPTPKPSNDTGSKIGAFFKEYFKSPITAVSSRSTNEYWLWGLISLSAYLLINFFVSLIGIGSISGFGYQFGYFIGDIVRFATLIFAYYLFQSVFKLKKKSLTAIISAVGLAFLPILPVYIIGLAIDRIFQYSSILQGLLTAVYVVAGIILFSELKESSKDESGARSLLTIAISIACMPLLSGIIDAVVYRIMYLPNIFPYIY